ncbi:MAG: hypothetical protein Q7U53_07405 [Anaerolineaceae bacterium]|nr:hypothetical protein [Anaerolineaceae bacterium]
MVTKPEIQTFIKHCKSKLDLSNLTQSEEYGYHNLPLCIIDAVFSINALYTSTENAVKRFCNYFGVTRLREKELAPTTEQLSISEFIKLHEGLTFQEMAEKVYQNRQRTSSRSGILKSEAVYLFATVVHQFGAEYLQDVVKVMGDPFFEAEIAKIPGQSSGLSTRYFYMLVGNEDAIKPDRMVRRFVFDAAHRELNAEECQELLSAACVELAKDYPTITPRSLDHQIWLYQREAVNE